MSWSDLIINGTSVNNPADALQLANATSQGTFWTGIFWLILVVAFVIITGIWSIEIAIIISFIFSTVVGIFLLYLGLISPTPFYTTEAILIFIIIYLAFTSKRNG